MLDPAAAAAARAYGLTLAAATVAAFLLSVGPDHWGVSACDELAINPATAAALAGLGLAPAGALFTERPLWGRAAALAAAAGAFVAIGLWFEPRCIGGRSP